MSLLKIKDLTNGTSVSNWKSYLAAQKTNDTPVQLVLQLSSPQYYSLDPKEIKPFIGHNEMYANSGDIRVIIGDAVYHGYVLTELPITATVNGTGQATLAVERDGDYHMDRPDESEFDGFDGETIAIKTQNGGQIFTIDNKPPDNDDLIGSLDDRASYKLVATIKDSLGQSAQAELPFKVRWSHQAMLPEDPTNLANISIDYEDNVALITPVQPEGAISGDSVDIYRLSADKPELIFRGAQFGNTYVDPYPTIGKFGGHRIVLRTMNGDYIIDDPKRKAWVDFGADEGDCLDIWGVLIDFDGNQIHLKYDIKLAADWKKDFIETKYLGGAIQGDWNPAVSRTGSVTTTTIVEEDAETIEMLRRLANHTGHCHIRTPDGSSFTCDIQVKEDREEQFVNKKATFTLSITRVDPVGYDAIPYGLWNV